MDDVYLEILFEIGIENIEKLDGTLLERDYLLDDVKYQKIKEKIFVLKKYCSSSMLTSLQENAEEKQKFPLINIVRQLLKVKYFKMEPIRKANGYEKSGKKKYKRFFLIKKMDE